MKLTELGTKHKTDKVGVHTFNGKNFLDIYETHFLPLKNNNVTILEMGILNGSSLRVWEDFFVNGKIIGLDIEPNKKIYETEKTKVYIGSQNDISVINQIKKDYPGGLDIIIDDASHLNSLTIDSFNLLFEFLNYDGYYVIEDTHCTYGSDDYPNFEALASKWPGMRYNNPNTSYKNDRKTFLDFILPKIHSLDHKKGNIFSIHFYAETLVIKKISKNN